MTSGPDQRQGEVQGTKKRQVGSERGEERRGKGDGRVVGELEGVGEEVVEEGGSEGIVLGHQLVPVVRPVVVRYPADPVGPLVPCPHQDIKREKVRS